MLICRHHSALLCMLSLTVFGWCTSQPYNISLTSLQHYPPAISQVTMFFSHITPAPACRTQWLSCGVPNWTVFYWYICSLKSLNNWKTWGFFDCTCGRFRSGHGKIYGHRLRRDVWRKILPNADGWAVEFSIEKYWQILKGTASDKYNGCNSAVQVTFV